MKWSNMKVKLSEDHLDKLICEWNCRGCDVEFSQIKIEMFDIYF